MHKLSSFNGQHSGRTVGLRRAERAARTVLPQAGEARGRRALAAQLRAGNGRIGRRNTAGRLWGTAPRHFVHLSTTPGGALPPGRGLGAPRLRGAGERARPCPGARRSRAGTRGASGLACRSSHGGEAAPIPNTSPPAAAGAARPPLPPSEAEGTPATPARAAAPPHRRYSSTELRWVQETSRSRPGYLVAQPREGTGALTGTPAAAAPPATRHRCRRSALRRGSAVLGCARLL